MGASLRTRATSPVVPRPGTFDQAIHPGRNFPTSSEMVGFSAPGEPTACVPPA
jgi:hypothetical protein